MLKRLFFFLVLFIWLPISSGQVNIDLKSGYIINLQHDSIFGNIVEFPYEYLSTRMVFIENGNDRKIQYTPEDLTGFHIDPDKDFIVMTMAEKEREGFVETKYFAMKAVEGEIELIILSLNDQKEQFFVSRENFGLSKLEQIIEIKDGFKYTFGRYKTTLGKYFYNAPELHQKIDQCDFNYTSLSRLVDDYNVSCNEYSSVVQKDVISWNISFHSGIDYYLGERMIFNNQAVGAFFGIKNSFYSKPRNMKIEPVVAINYRFFAFDRNLLLNTDANGRIVNYQDWRYYFPFWRYYFYLGQDGFSNDSAVNRGSFLYSFRGDMLEFPLFIEYNNKIRLISPLFQAGLKPFLLKNTVKLQDYGTFETDWSLTTQFILSCGVGVNYKRLHFRYLLNADPWLMNTCCLEFKLK